MAETTVTAATDAQIETREDLQDGGKSDAALWQFWDIQEAIAEKEEREWRRNGEKVLRRYRDRRRPDDKSKHRFNILWSNVQTLKPALYSRVPKADVQRRWKDQDDVGRLASTLLERACEYCLEAYGFDAGMRAAVDDVLLPGRGVCRVLYVPHYGEPIKDEGKEGDEEGAADTVASDSDKQSSEQSNASNEGAKSDAGRAEPEDAQPTEDAQPAQEPEREVVWEEARIKFVHWSDYREGPARQWDEVPWIRYRAFMTRDELIARFGKKKAKLVKLDYTPKGVEQHEKEGAPADAYKKAIIYETWDKTEREVVWWAPNTPDLILDRKDDPLKLRDFYANPDPLLATTTTDTRIPVADYDEYRDQAEELDTLTARIERLQRSLKVFGLYPGDEKKTLSQLVSDDTENLLIPVDDWQALLDKGGLEGVIQWFPIKEIAEALIRLYDARDKVKQIIYEITGIADIIRGATESEETATAQQIKSNFATMRLSDRQRAVQRFARDLIQLMAQIVGTHFSAQTISLMTGYPQLLPQPQLPPPPQMPPSLAHPPTTATMPGAPPPPPDPAAQQYQQAMQAYQQQVQQAQQVQQENERRTQEFQAAVDLIREDVVADFRIDIEADSTITGDEEAEKQARIEFLQQMVPLLEQVIPISQGVPPMASLSKEIVLFAARAFKAGRPLEEALEAAFDAIAKMPPNPKAQGMDQKGGGKDPKAQQMEAQAKLQAVQVDAQAHMHDVQVQSQAQEQDAQTKMWTAMQQNATKLRQIAGQEQIQREKMEFERHNAAIGHAMERDRAANEHELQQARVMSLNARSANSLV